MTAGTPVTLTATVIDTQYNNTNGTEPTQNVAAAEVYIDIPPWMPGATALPLSAADGAFNAKTEGVTTVLSTTGLAKGKHMVFVRGKDAANNFGPISASFLKIL